MGVDLDNPDSWGDVEHVVWCNASRREPVGCPGCSCLTGRALRALRAENERLRAEFLSAQSWRKVADAFEEQLLDARAENERLRDLLKRCIKPHDYVDAVRLEGEIRMALDAKEGT